MAVISEANWRAMRGGVAGRRGTVIASAARLGIAAAAILIFVVLPLQAQTEKVLHSFAGPTADGGSPSGSLARDGKGNLYGTTQSGGTSGSGTVFELAINPDGSYTESVLYSFAATGGDGHLPVAGLVIDGSGKLYGTTQAGGTSMACSFGCGTVFKLDNSSGSYKYGQLYSFTGSPDGEAPGALLIDAHGNLYGTTLFGGTSKTANCKSGCGTVFKLAINPDGSYTPSVLYRFAATGDGINPQGNLVIDSAGHLYGTTAAGGGSGYGIVFELDNSSGTYKDNLLHSFTGGSDGEIPTSGLVVDAHGNLYGTAENGGSTACPMGCGTVFELTNNSGSYSFTAAPLYSFTGSPDAQNPVSLVIDASGNLYGTAGGGASTACNGCGTVFELANKSGSYTYTGVLYSFTGSPDGAQPTGLIVDASGNLYGTTGLGGTSTVCSLSGCGTVFEVAPGPARPTYVFSATSGSGQSATVNTQFASQLGVTVLDANGNPPASAVTVTFTASASAGGASGTFANGTATTTAPTNPLGVATASVFTASGTVGSYTVTATAPNVTGTASFSLTNLAAQIQTTTTFTTSSSFHGQTLPSGVALVGNPVTVNFTVKPASGTAAPTGSVLVTDGGLGDPCLPSPTPLNASGQGSCTLTIATFPSGGITSLSAAYTSNLNAFLSSNSLAATEQVVEGVVPCGGAIAPVTVQQKATATETFTVCLAGNLNLGAGPLTVHILECLPFAQCSVTITPVPNEPGVYTVTVKMITSDAGNGTAWSPVLLPRGGPGPWPLTLFAFAALLAILMALQSGRQNPARPRVLYAAGLLFAMVLSGMSACNGGSNQQVTPVGPYTINLTVTAGTFTATVPLSVTVTK